MHRTKLVWRDPAQNVPAGQGVHAPAFAVAPYVPAGQLVHEVAPAAAYVPAGQLVHTLESINEYEPAGQTLQLDAPAPAYLPAGHGWHWFDPTARRNASSEWSVGLQERDVRTVGVRPAGARPTRCLAARRVRAWLTGGGRDRGGEQREQEPGEGGDRETRAEDHIWR